MTDAQRERFEAGLIDYYERLELNGTPSFEGKEINTKFGNGWIYRDPYMNHAFTGWQAAEAQQQARIDELLSTLKDLPWRIEDIADALQSRGVGGQRIYSCDEWSTPVLNLNTMLGKVINAILAAGGGVR